MNTPLTGPGNLIKGRWKILKKIGQGAFGEVYSARNVVTSELVAIKVERVDSTKQVLKLEVAVLKKLQSAACPYAVSFITCGRHNDYNYMVMELLGENISELRRSQPNGRFSMLTTLKIGLQMLRAIEAVHDLGYLHRDIKPSNFAMGLAPSKRHSCYLIDFGLARRYVLPNGDVRPPRGQTGFRGTARYASINSHQCKDLSRRDDLWSLLYVLIEFAKGKLPWRRTKDKDEVGDMKLRLNNPGLVADLPQEFLFFMQHLQTLRYVARPNYSFLHNLLNDLYHKLGGDDNTPFDWERERVSGPRRPRPIPTLLDLCFLKVATNLSLYPTLKVSFTLRKRMLDFLLRINNGKWSPELMEKIIDPALTQLDLENCDIQEEDYRAICNTCTSLRQISLGNTSDIMIKDLTVHNKALEQLCLRGSKQLTTKGTKLIADTFTNLKVLHIKNSDRVTDKAMESILKSCTQLTELSLAGCRKFKGAGFKPFTNSSKKRVLNLKKLDLSACELNKRGFKHLIKICSTLEELIFAPLVATFKISGDDFQLLIKGCSGLSVLELSNYQFEMDTILIELSRNCKNLSTLLLDGLGMTDYGLQSVVQSCNRLQTLRFRYGDGVSDASLTQIARSCTLTSLTLDFWNKFNRLSVSDQGIKTLLQACGNLKELSLCSCLILTGACFPETVYFPNLELLNLSECIQLNDFAIRRITESCPNLKSLSLNNLNNLSTAALEAIALGCPLLEELHLQQCACFSDEAMEELLIGMPKLFLFTTRFVDPDLRGEQKEVHCTNVKQIFSEFPNTYRERAFDRTRRRMYGMEG